MRAIVHVFLSSAVVIFTRSAYLEQLIKTVYYIFSVLDCTFYLNTLTLYIVTCQPAVGLRGRGCAAERC
jgi:hypothetical protein